LDQNSYTKKEKDNQFPNKFLNFTFPGLSKLFWSSVKDRLGHPPSQLELEFVVSVRQKELNADKV